MFKGLSLSSHFAITDRPSRRGWLLYVLIVAYSLSTRIAIAVSISM